MTHPNRSSAWWVSPVDYFLASAGVFFSEKLGLKSRPTGATF